MNAIEPVEVPIGSTAPYTIAEQIVRAAIIRSYRRRLIASAISHEGNPRETGD
jgi:hypothetical protein